jgi:hypothetical protein
VWKCGNTWSLPILITRAAYPYFLIETLLTNLLFNYRFLHMEGCIHYSPSLAVHDFFTAVIAKRIHPFPFRTRKLSSLAPMVLHGRLCGRVGHRRFFIAKAPNTNVFGAFVVLPSQATFLLLLYRRCNNYIVSILKPLFSPNSSLFSSLNPWIINYMPPMDISF